MTATDSTLALTASTSPANSGATAKPAKGKSRFAGAQAVLEQLAHLYPQLFGAHFVPLKRGIFQDLLKLHPDLFDKTALRDALGVRTRSSRYLQCVAQGLARCDLQGQAVEPVAAEHVVLALVDLFKRRQARSPEDLKPKLRRQLQAAYQASGLTRHDYLLRLSGLDNEMASLLDEAIVAADQLRARQAALLKAFDASGKSAADFAAELGLPIKQLNAALSTRPANQKPNHQPAAPI